MAYQKTIEVASISNIPVQEKRVCRKPSDGDPDYFPVVELDRANQLTYPCSKLLDQVAHSSTLMQRISPEGCKVSLMVKCSG